LYSPYVGLNRNPDPTPPRFEDFALSEIERAAADIADNVYILLNGVEKEAIPIML
jgi:hypothetical protein